MRIFLTVFSFIAFSAFVTEPFQSKVVNVIDGNTIEIVDQDQAIIKVVFLGIDSPELTQEFGADAKKLTEQLLLNKEVSVTLSGKDRWGNYIATVKLLKNNLDPRVELLEKGLAWTSEKNPLPELEQVRMEAKEKGKGLWKDPGAVPPWIYRRQQTMMQAKSSAP